MKISSNHGANTRTVRVEPNRYGNWGACGPFLGLRLCTKVHIISIKVHSNVQSISEFKSGDEFMSLDEIVAPTWRTCRRPKGNSPCAQWAINQQVNYNDTNRSISVDRRYDMIDNNWLMARNTGAETKMSLKRVSGMFLSYFERSKFCHYDNNGKN